MIQIRYPPVPVPYIFKLFYLYCLLENPPNGITSKLQEVITLYDYL